MIKINFSSAVSAYLCFSIFLVFVFWIFYNLRRNGIFNETEYLQQCPYCTYVFFNYTSDTLEPKTVGMEENRNKESSKLTPSLPETDKLHNEKSHFLICPRCQSYINLKNDTSKR